jgi:hypothetical protein
VREFFGAVHIDLYDGGGKDVIPFDKLDAFFTEHLQERKTVWAAYLLFPLVSGRKAIQTS